MNKICQSCGMPMRKDPEGGGTNADVPGLVVHAEHSAVEAVERGVREDGARHSCPPESGILD
jgi:hypothetical protein